MDEEQGIRVTRLRRRLSVEQVEDVSSPAGTPTKKRVTKLPKPALDNISENAVVDSPKRATRRSIALDTTADDVVTPGKRVRGKANTSLLSESINGAESPRATRTTRRHSLVGNECETTVITPVRRSRRISKDSPETVVEIKVTAKKSRRLSAASQDVIAEENEKDDENLISFSPESYKNQQQELIKDQTSASENTSPTSVRKSPRLSLKKNTGKEANMSIEETSRSAVSAEKKSSGKKSKQNSESGPMNRSSNYANDSISELTSIEETPKSSTSTEIISSSKKSKQSLESDSKKKSKQSLESDSKKKSSNNANGDISVISSEEKNSKIRSKSFTLLEQDLKNDSRIYHSDSECRASKSNKTANIFQQGLLKASPSKLEENKENFNKTHQKKDIYCYKPPNNISGIEILEKTKCQLIDDSVDGKNEEWVEPENNLHSSITSNIIMEDSDYNEEKNKSNFFYVPKKAESENDDCEPMDVDEDLPEKSVNVPNDKSLFEETKVEDGLEKDEPQGQINVPSITNNNSATMKSVLTESIKGIDSPKVVTSPKNYFVVSKSFETSITKETVDKKNNTSLEKSGTPIQIKALLKSGPCTSTPVTNDKQPGQKGTSKLLRQETINSVVKENSSEEDTSEDENEKQETLVDNEAEDAGEDYKSGDSQSESEREYDNQNQIPVKGETLDSQEDEESDESDYEKDSFVVSSDAEDEELLSGSGDDLALSDNELKMSKKSKEKYNKQREKEQKEASREMFEARHGKSKEKVEDPVDESDDADVVFTRKNKKRNRLRLDSSKETSNTNVCVEQEITIIAETSQSDKDPLINDLPIKKEVLSANNTVLDEIENVELDQDVTVFANKEDNNPLQSFDGHEQSHSESSDDGGIADNYDSLLKDLNSSKDNVKSSDQSQINSVNADCTDGNQINVLSMGLSYSEYKATKNKKENSLLDKLNVTTSRLDHSDNLQSSIKFMKGSSSPEKNSEKNKVGSKMNSVLLTSLNTSVKRNGSTNTSNENLNTSKKSKKESEYIQKENSINSETENLNASKKSEKKRKSLMNESGQIENIISEKFFDKSYVSINNDSFKLSNSLKISEKTKKNKSINEGSREKSVDKNGAKDKSLNSSNTQSVDCFGNDSNPSSKRKKKNISLSDICTSNESKEDSIIKKLNLTSSGKEKKAKYSNADKEKNVSENADSSDEIDFKLLFTQDESSNDSYPQKETKTTNTKIILTEEKVVSSNIGPSPKTKSKKGEHIAEKLVLNDSNRDDVENVQKNKSKKKQKELENTKVEDMQPDQLSQEQSQQKSRKRKRKEVIPVDNNNKVYLTNDDNKVKVKKLPQGILDKLADKIEIFPTEKPADKKAKAKVKSAISTSNFEVQTVIPKKTKPSQYLEDSIHIDRSPKRRDEIKRVKRPKVLPSVPKASTSTVGFTSNFRVNVMKEDARHDAVLAGPDHIPNFKTQRFNKVKRIDTEELCRTNKRIRMKF